jgi:hypothetical protein
VFAVQLDNGSFQTKRADRYARTDLDFRGPT